MALTFVLGNAGSGKSTFLRNFILDEAAKHPEKKYLVLVPEQFTMSTQKEYVEASEKKCIMNVDVLSFERLAYRVFDELGMSDLNVLEDIGKILVLRKIVQSHKEQLTTLKKKVEKPGYLDQVKSLLTEFMQYNITVDDIGKMLQNMPQNILYYKLQDLHILYQGVEDYMQGSYVTAEKLLVLLAEVAEKSAMLKDAVVCFDGYTGFTPVQNLFMRKLLPLAQDVYATVLLDVREDARVCSGNHELFYISKKYIRQMTELAKQTNTEIKPDIVMVNPSERRFVEAPGLASLERNIFHPKKEIFKDEQDNIEIVRCMNPKKELHYVAGRIRQLVKMGYRYEDMAIVTGDLATYGRYVKNIFNKGNIPYFLDEKDTIIYNGFVELLKGALQMICDDFSAESVFRYLKSGMTNVTNIEIEKLENYVLALRIRGYKMYAQDFVRRNRNYSEEDLYALNEIRMKFMEPLCSFVEQMHTDNADVTVYSKALYALLDYYRVDAKLEEEGAYLEQLGDIKRSREYRQSYELLIRLLEKCVALLGNERMTAEEYLEILTAGLEHSKIGTIPAGRDRIIIGDIERTRLEHIKVLFFVGVNDGIIPRVTSGSMCLSQKERQQLQEMDVELAASPRERSFIQQFYLYLVMTKPSEKLILTYRESSSEGGEEKPAYIIDQLHSIFPKLEEKVGEIKQLISPELSMQRMVEEIGQDKETKVGRALYDWYLSNPEWKNNLEPLIEQAKKVYKDERLSAEVAKALYGEQLRGSVSRFEDYSKCAMKHFLDYGMRLEIREEGEFKATELGTIVHKALELYGKTLAANDESFSNVSEDKKEQYVHEAINQAIAEQLDSALYENPRSEYQIERIRRLIERSVWSLTRQFGESNYEPKLYEQRFDDRLNPDSTIRISGVVDRIDLSTNAEGMTYRVVDYKTGKSEIDLKKIYAGLQLQLMAYLDAADKVLKKHYPEETFKPDGAYYYWVNDPMIELKSDEYVSDEKLAEKLDKELQMTGFGRNEHDDKAVKTKKLVPSMNELEMVVEYAKDKMESIGEEILAGHIEAKPYRLEEANGCEYCSYKGICGFDEKLPGYQYRQYEKLTDEEVMANIKCKE